MIVVTHPHLYQFSHPWHWLTYGQNAEALGVILAAILSILSIIVLARTLRAINKQALAADKQATAADEQVLAAKSATAVSDAQRIAAEASASAERAHNELIRIQLLNEMRPVIVIGKRPHPTMTGSMQIIASNHGSGVALNITMNYMDGARDSISISQNILGPGQSMNFVLDMTRVQLIGFQLRYFSQDGRLFATTVRLHNQEFFSEALEINTKGGWIKPPSIPSGVESSENSA
jgi:hypothetical protein